MPANSISQYPNKAQVCVWENQDEDANRWMPNTHHCAMPLIHCESPTTSNPLIHCTHPGGWRVRVALAAAIFAKPDILLLDEPTNHLSIEAVLWLQNELVTSIDWASRIIITVSHDRAFLDAVCTDCMHISGAARRLTQTRGTYSAWAKRRATVCVWCVWGGATCFICTRSVRCCVVRITSPRVCRICADPTGTPWQDQEVWKRSLEQRAAKRAHLMEVGRNLGVQQPPMSLTNEHGHKLMGGLFVTLSAGVSKLS